MAANNLVHQFKTVFTQLSTGRKISLVAMTVGTLAMFVAIIFWAGRPEYGVLFSDLALEDAGSIVSQLKTEKVPYTLSANGTTVSVPRDLIYETRLKMAGKGLPQGGSVGFEIFDNTKLGMTEFVQNVNYQRALQGELARTITRFSEVESARVHIVLPPKTLFVEEEKPATASVVLNMRAGKRLSRDQIQSIVYLVSASVTGLDTDNVTVVDNRGKMLAGFERGDDFSQMSLDQLGLQEKVEKKLQERVTSMLETALGRNKAIVRLSVNLNFNRRERTEERYHPDNQVVRSEKVFREQSSDSKNRSVGVPGVASNLPESSMESSSTAANNSFEKQDRTVNYEIGKEVHRIVEPVGGIRRISAAVIVDGTYRQVADDEGQTTYKYFPRSEAEMRQLENIVKRAVNFDAARGDEIEVVNLPIESARVTEDAPAPPEGWLTKVKEYSAFVKYLVLAIFVMLTFLFVIRPIMRWLTTIGEDNEQMYKQLPMTVGELEGGMGEKLGNVSFREQALQWIRTDFDGSLHQMREWLKDETN